MRKVRFGIIGVGVMGMKHLGFFQSGAVENGEVVALADIDAAKLKAAQAAYPETAFELYDSADALIAAETVDAVIVSTPHYFHPPIAIKALEADLHVLTEKPAGVYTKQVKEVNAVAATSRGLYTVMYNQRTNCLYRKMREMIADGNIGELKRVNMVATDWYRPQSYYNSSDWRATWKGEGGGVLFNQAVHQLDLMQWILAQTPARVRAHCHFGKWHDIETEDDVTAYFEFSGGATGTFVTSTADVPGINRLEVLGTLGRLAVDGGKLLYTANAVDERGFCYDTDKTHGKIETTTIEVPTDGADAEHEGILNNFANAILGIEPLYVDGQEGLYAVEMMNAFLMSEWLDRPIDLPIDDDLYLELLNKHIEESERNK